VGDFVKGFMGTLLCWFLGVAGIVLIFASIFTSSAWLLILSIVCFAAVAGIRYWLGHIVRVR